MVIALCLVSFTFVSCSSETLSAVVAPSVDTLSADGLKQLVESGEKFIFVDVRETSELAQDGTLANHLHIPIGQLEKRLSEVPKDTKVVVACARGVRAGRGAALLQKNGYKDVVSMGLAEYRAKGYALVYPKAAK